MTTEAGLPRITVARRNIETLRRRIDYLDERVQARVDVGLDETHSGFDVAEAAALQWALPILEAEWDAIARMRRDLGLQIGQPRSPSHNGETITESLSAAS